MGYVVMHTFRARKKDGPLEEWVARDYVREPFDGYLPKPKLFENLDEAREVAEPVGGIVITYTQFIREFHVKRSLAL